MAYRYILFGSHSVINTSFFWKNWEIWSLGPISSSGKSQGRWGGVVWKNACHGKQRHRFHNLPWPLPLICFWYSPRDILVGISSGHVPRFHRDHAVGWGGLGESWNEKPGWNGKHSSHCSRCHLGDGWSYALHPSLPKPLLHSLFLNSCTVAVHSSGLEFEVRNGKRGSSFF